jgi:hypothetical protein
LKRPASARNLRRVPHDVIVPNPWMILPFGILLAAIALGPLFFSNNRTSWPFRTDRVYVSRVENIRRR